MSDPVLRLYPGPTADVPLENLYLGLDLRGHDPPGRPFVYSAFITSLDGRISVADKTGVVQGVPETIANPRDWRLFQELAIQADVIITSGRYVRELAEQRAGRIITVYEDEAMADLRSWRADHSLPDYPALAVVSNTLDFDPAVLGHGDVVAVSTGSADPSRVAELQASGVSVVQAGDGERVSGRALAEQLYRRGYETAFSAAGPQILRMLLAGGAVDRLFVTIAGLALGGDRYATMVEGPPLEPSSAMRLVAAYLDPVALDGAGQTFLVYTA